jgi:hypothetical protein
MGLTMGKSNFIFQSSKDLIAGLPAEQVGDVSADFFVPLEGIQGKL